MLQPHEAGVSQTVNVRRSVPAIVFVLAVYEQVTHNSGTRDTRPTLASRLLGNVFSLLASPDVSVHDVESARLTDSASPAGKRLPFHLTGRCLTLLIDVLVAWLLGWLADLEEVGCSQQP